jgi:predicted metalloprotease
MEFGKTQPKPGRSAGECRSRGAGGGSLGVIVVVLVALSLGVDPAVILQSLPPGDTSPASSEPYRRSGAVQSACGLTGSAVGPFYCPSDQKVFIDLAFFRDLADRFQAPGDFARAYVIAHEGGHHVQTLLGISRKVRGLQQRADRARQILEQGHIEEGLTAASAIGDDQIQKRTQGYVLPEAFIDGNSALRVRWLQPGLKSGDPDQCDAFGSRSL